MISSDALIFDTETTGVDEPRIVEAAWLRISDPQSLRVTGKFCERYNPGKRIETGAMAIHHIMDEDLTECPPSTAFTLPPDVQYIIGHNVDYDWRVIGEPPVKRICVLALCRALFPTANSHKQSAMLYQLDRANARNLLQQAHSAECDVSNCLIILRHLLGVIEGVGEQFGWEDLWLKSESARIPTVMSFGKHKGMPVADIPDDYKKWLLRQDDVDPYLAKALKGAGVATPHQRSFGALNY